MKDRRYNKTYDIIGKKHKLIGVFTDKLGVYPIIKCNVRRGILELDHPLYDHYIDELNIHLNVDMITPSCGGFWSGSILKDTINILPLRLAYHSLKDLKRRRRTGCQSLSLILD